MIGKWSVWLKSLSGVLRALERRLMNDVRFLQCSDFSIIKYLKNPINGISVNKMSSSYRLGVLKDLSLFWSNFSLNKSELFSKSFSQWIIWAIFQRIVLSKKEKNPFLFHKERLVFKWMNECVWFVLARNFNCCWKGFCWASSWEIGALPISIPDFSCGLLEPWKWQSTWEFYLGTVSSQTDDIYETNFLLTISTSQLLTSHFC